MVHYFFLGTPEAASEIKWGVTFSRDQAVSLGLDWKKTYGAIVDDLGVSHIRITIPWTNIEQSEGVFDFADTHFMMSEAQKKGVAVIPVIGQKVPRWPECHTPDWAKQLNDKDRSEKVLNVIERTVKELKKYDAIIAWQVENEPFFGIFGDCPNISPDLLGREIERVKSIDHRPIMITDSGELGLWRTGVDQADILGVTMYRRVWSPIFKYAHYPLTPKYYFRRAELVRRAHPNLRVLGSELQAEPWVMQGSLADAPLAEQELTMTIDQFKENITFAQKTGIDEHYLWGAEWWYWMKEQKGDARYWNEAKHLWE